MLTEPLVHEPLREKDWEGGRSPALFLTLCSLLILAYALLRFRALHCLMLSCLDVLLKVLLGEQPKPKLLPTGPSEAKNFLS